MYAWRVAPPSDACPPCRLPRSPSFSPTTTAVPAAPRSDSLEEMVGLDIGYTGNTRHRDVLDKELQNQIDAFMGEYEHRTRERAYFKKQGRGPFGSIPASSLHNDQLHGNSYHGRKIVVDPLEVSRNAARREHHDPLDESRNASREHNISERLDNDAAAGDVNI